MILFPTTRHIELKVYNKKHVQSEILSLLYIVM